MKRRYFLGTLLGTAAIAALGGCSPFYPSATIRYRMTVEVETPQGIKTGSSVIETTIQSGPRIGEAGGVSYHYRGEAVAVDLPGGKTLFALMTGGSSGADYHAHLLNDALTYGTTTPALSRKYKSEEWLQERREAARVKPFIVLPLGMPPSRFGPRSCYPMLVTFGDVGDPKTVEKVDPDDLAKSFGPGMTLKRITLQITDEPVTTGIEKRLGWLLRLHGGYLHGGFTSRDAPLGLSGGVFSTENFK